MLLIGILLKRLKIFAEAIEQQISEIKDIKKREKMLNWVKWARERADWVDPLIVKEDELLGIKADIQND